MKKILSSVASLMLCSVALNAAGTAAGTTVSNSASLTYTVSGAVQPTVSTQNAATFVVDKKIDFSLVHDDDPKHIITTPGSEDVERSFTLENTTNKIQDFTVTATSLASGKVYNSQTDDSEVENLEISVNGGAWTTGTVTIADLGVDASITIAVRSDIPSTNVDGNVMNIQLEATAVKDGTTTAETSTSSVDDKDVEDTVLAEGAGYTGDDNVEFNGKYAAWAGYVINSPVLTLIKSSCVYKDLVSGVSADAKRIPGSTITYLFDIENTGSIDSSDINITDDLATELDVTTVTAVKTNDNQDSCTCSGGVAGAGSAATTVISGQTVAINDLTVKKDKHNCVTLQVNIK